MTRKYFCRAFAAVVAAGFAGTCVAGAGKLAPELRGGSAGHVDVIVQYRTVPGPFEYDKLGNRGGKLNRALPVIKAAFASLPTSALDELAADPDVAYISPDRKLNSLVDCGVPAVTADIARTYGWNGAGIAVAVIDSGILSRPDLADDSSRSRIVYSESFIDSGNGTIDQFGHGTHVAGIIGGSGKLSTGANYTVTFRGVAPGVSIVNLRALDADGSGSDSSVIAAIQRAIELKDAYNIRVMNLSLGRPVYDAVANDPLCQAVEQAWKAGIVVVAAAGNNGRDNTFGNQGYGTILSPGNDPYVITVGATNTKGSAGKSDDVVTSYSSKGPTGFDLYVKPDIVAPGNRIVSLAGPGTLFRQFPQNIVPLSYYSTRGAGGSGQYFRLSGTSMAAGFVSGAAALMLQKDPALTPDQVKVRMMKTAWKGFDGAVSVVSDPAFPGVSYTTVHDVFATGAGYLDVQAALADTELAAGSALSPRVAFDPVNGQMYLDFGADSVSALRRNVVWGSNVVWGAGAGQILTSRCNVVWGSSVFLGWASRLNVVWGSSSLATDPLAIAIAGEQ